MGFDAVPNRKRLEPKGLSVVNKRCGWQIALRNTSQWSTAPGFTKKLPN